jgi:hypothetical protein
MGRDSYNSYICSIIIYIKSLSMPEQGRDEKGRFTYANLFRKGMEKCGGKEPMFADADELAKEIAKYIEYKDSLKRVDAVSKIGKGVYTIAGLCLFLGFSTRQSFYDYEKKDPTFAYVLNRFRLLMIDWNEEKLYWGGTFMAAQFWLKNYGGYVEESTENQNQRITNVTVEVVPSEHKINTSEKDIEI